jgi:hypothetical protein
LLESVYIHFHILRTGGTAFQNYIGNPYDRTKDNCWYHYNWTENYSSIKYNLGNLPLLRFRTKEQHKKIKIISGHSTFSNSHRWLKIRKIPKYITFVRDPLERILSSFNYRYKRKTLSQDNVLFTANPTMNYNAVNEKKIETDYDSLYEFYKDAYVEQNLQTKWIIKSFLKWNEHNNWQFFPTYQGIENLVFDQKNLYPPSMPEWMWFDNNYNYWEIAEKLIEKFYWIDTTDNLKENTKDFCNFINIDFCDNVFENKSTDIIQPYWTMDDVKKQPDYEKIIEEEKYDYQLYNYVKTYCKRPF